MEEEIKKLGLKVKALEDISSTTGIHPMGALPDEERKQIEKEKSNAYKVGWNNCAIEYAKRTTMVMKKDWGKLNDDVLLLLASGGCMLMGGELVVNVNDTFAWGCADCEEVPEDKISEVANLYRQYGSVGPVYWVSKQRGWMMPCASDGPTFKQTKKEIEKIRKEQNKVEKFARGQYKKNRRK